MNKLGYIAAVLQEVLWLNTAQAEDARYVWFTSRHLTIRETAHRRSRDCCVNRVPSLRTFVGIVEDCATFEAANLTGPFAAPGQDVVDEPLVNTARVRGDPAGVSSGFLNHLGFHRHLHCFER